MDRLLRPTTIAIVGLSSDPTKHGGRVLTNLRKVGFGGDVWGVNPKRPDVDGVDVFASVADLPEPPDVLVCAVPGPVVPGVVRAAEGAGAAVVFAGGFAETGHGGTELQRRLEAAAETSGVRVLGPNSGGVIVPSASVAMSFLTCLDRPAAQIRSGPVGLVTQSGGTGSYIHNLAAAQGSGLAASISVGNEVDIDLADGIEMLATFDEVRTIALVLESVRDGRRFMDAVEAADEAGKRVVAIRLGSTEQGAAMTGSHTGALATPSRVFEGVAAATGVVLTETPDELFEVAQLLGRVGAGRVGAGRVGSGRVGIVTHSGGVAILLADLATRHEIDLPPPSADLMARVEPLLQQGSAANPLDMGGIIGGVHRFAEVVDLFAAEYDHVLAVSSAHPPGHSAERVASLLGLDSQPIHLWMAGDVAADSLADLRTAGAPVTVEPRAAVAALAALARPPARRVRSPRVAAAGSLVRGEFALKAMLAGVGVAVPEGILARSKDELLEFGRRASRPLAVKVHDPGLAHKSDIGGVVLGVGGAAELSSTWDRLVEVCGSVGIEFDGVLVEHMVSGPEAIVGVTRDPSFGTIATFGLGGVHAEQLDQTATMPGGFDPDVAVAVLRRLPSIGLLANPRRGSAADLLALAELAVVVQGLVDATPHILELDLNPVVWDGARWVVVDAFAVTSSGRPRP